jgi:hypothetical protein
MRGAPVAFAGPVFPARTLERITSPLAFLAMAACGSSSGGSPIAAPPEDAAVDASSGPIQASAVLVKSNCSPVAATSDGALMAFNVRGSSGLFDAYLGTTACDGPALLPSYDGNRGAADMTGDGRYVLLVTARGWDKATAGAEPGKGSSNSIDILDRTTGALSTLVPSYCTNCQRGAIWPRFSPDGTRVVWAELVQTPLEVSPIGRWYLHVSTLGADRTSVASDRTWQPRSAGSVLVEAYGWIPGTSDVIFAANDGVTNCSSTSCLQLFRISDELPDAAATLITQPVNGANAYHEFAHFRGDGWIYTSIGQEAEGADLWRMTPDGSNQERVTFFGGEWSLAQAAFAQTPGFPAPSYSIVGGMATVPGGFVAGVIHDDTASTIDAWRIDITAK